MVVVLEAVAPIHLVHLPRLVSMASVSVTLMDVADVSRLFGVVPAPTDRKACYSHRAGSSVSTPLSRQPGSGRTHRGWRQRPPVEGSRAKRQTASVSLLARLKTGPAARKAFPDVPAATRQG